MGAGVSICGKCEKEICEDCKQFPHPNTVCTDCDNPKPIFTNMYDDGETIYFS